MCLYYLIKNAYIYICIYMYVLFSPVKPESGIIPLGQLNYSTMNI